jgi:23S rRNA (cytosine1962-C5)-methyltransferase
LSANAPGVVRLKPGKEKPVRQSHPWVFSGAIAMVDGSPAPGDVVEVRDARDGWLARGYYNPRSQIVVRLLTWVQDEPVDDAFWRRRLGEASARRAALASDPRTSAYRLIYAESDRLPGLVVDRYDDWLVVQFLTSAWRPAAVP